MLVVWFSQAVSRERKGCGFAEYPADRRPAPVQFVGNAGQIPTVAVMVGQSFGHEFGISSPGRIACAQTRRNVRKILACDVGQVRRRENRLEYIWWRVHELVVRERRIRLRYGVVVARVVTVRTLLAEGRVGEGE